MSEHSLTELIEMYLENPNLGEFQKKQIIKAITNIDPQENEDQFLSRFSPDEVTFLVEKFPYPIPEHLCAFAIDILLEMKIKSLRTGPRYYSIILDYFDSLRSLSKRMTRENRYESVLNSISRLWLGSRKDPAIFKTAKDFEPILQRIPHYRDHFIHSFNVFLLGYYIINRLNEIHPNSYFKSDDYNLTWMLTATFHDVAYPLQEIESWLNDLLKKFLGVSPNFYYNITQLIPII